MRDNLARKLAWPMQEGATVMGVSGRGLRLRSSSGEFEARRAAGVQQTGDKPTPYHGYYFRILKGQGAKASGGAYSYVVNGKMLGGFGLIAYPATYGNSGVMTFIMNHDGVIYEKDLGPKTAELVQKITVFNPDDTWKRQ